MAAAEFGSRVATLEAEARHVRELLELHAQQTADGFMRAEEKRQELAADLTTVSSKVSAVDDKVGTLLDKVSQGKGVLLTLSVVLPLVFGAVGAKIAAALTHFVR